VKGLLHRPDAPAYGPPPELSDVEFQGLRELIQRHSGIHLNDTKKALVSARLRRRLQHLGLSSFGAYYRHVVEGDGGELVQLLDAICTHETHFFRDPAQFHCLTRHIVPEWRQHGGATGGRSLRVWSAGCSTGEEPYSLAMALCEQLPDWHLEILATDLSTRALHAAQQGIWPLDQAHEIPDRLLRRYMLKGVRSQDGRMTAGPEIRAVVRFARVNLLDLPPLGAPFDLIFCRNVLIYFDLPAKRQVIEQLTERLAPRGYLFVSRAESLNGITSRLRSVASAVHVHADRRPLPRFDVADGRPPIGDR
jgi:chemotaxis protein methyltransferase CheR